MESGSRVSDLVATQKAFDIGMIHGAVKDEIPFWKDLEGDLGLLFTSCISLETSLKVSRVSTFSSFRWSNDGDHEGQMDN